MFLSVEIANGPEFNGRMSRAASELERGFPDAIERIGHELAGSIDEQFLHGGIPAWAPLTPYTLLMRRLWERTTGRKLVAGLRAPLRRSDELRKASTATSIGIHGSAFAKTAMEVQVGPDEQVLEHARRLNEGDPGENLPAREFIVLSPLHEARSYQIAQDAFDDFAERFGVE